MQKYIHIGYPKNLSTTLQRDYFPMHSQIFHLGVGIGSNIDYINDKINLACEDYLIYATDRKYRRVKNFVADAFNEMFDEAGKTNGKKVTGISAELLSFKFSPDHADIETKAKRLHEVFGSNTKIIMIIRNQPDLLKSLYKECIKLGYTKTYQEFIEYCYYFHDRNFVLDFCYDETIQLYADLFGSKNMVVIPIEKVRDRESGGLKMADGKYLLLDEIGNALDVNYEPLTLQKNNDPLNDVELLAMLNHNKVKRHNLGTDVYGTANGHRLVKYFNLDLGMPLSKNLYHEYISKKENIDASMEAGKTGGANRKIDFYCDQLIWQKLMDIYKPSNEKLKKLHPDLPSEYSF